MLRQFQQTLCVLFGLGISACGGAAAQKQPSDTASSGGGAGGPSDSGCSYAGVSHESGSSFPSSDGCNTCSCTAGGVACTKRACAQTACGARAGDTCGASEYCAYTPGQYCGAADAQAHCSPRPDACAEIHAPVCGCDGKTYSNACDANRQGQGVNADGECPPSG